MKSVLLLGTLLTMNSLYAEEVDYSLCQKLLSDKSRAETPLEMNDKGEINPTFTPKSKSTPNAETTEYVYEYKITEKKKEFINSGIISVVKNENGKTTDLKLTRTDDGGFTTAKVNYTFSVKNGYCYPSSSNIGLTSNSRLLRAMLSPMKDGMTISTQACRDVHAFFQNNPELKTCSDPSVLMKLSRLMNRVSRETIGLEESFQSEGELRKAIKKKLDPAYKNVTNAQDFLDRCDDYGLAAAVQKEELWKEAVKESAKDGIEIHTISK